MWIAPILGLGTTNIITAKGISAETRRMKLLWNLKAQVRKWLSSRMLGRHQDYRPDNGGNKLLRTVGQYLPDYIAQHSTRQPSWNSSLWEPEISTKSNIVSCVQEQPNSYHIGGDGDHRRHTTDFDFIRRHATSAVYRPTACLPVSWDCTGLHGVIA